MKRKPIWQALAGIALLIVGALWTYAGAQGYVEKRVNAVAGACRADMTIIQKREAPAQANSGAVVLFHGLAANKYIMRYLARSFAELGLTVYVPDLPGHGRTPGPFSAQNAEDCGRSLLRGLSARGLIVPDRTILAGHSMGGAIALRLAPEFRPAVVIAFSPAPMQAKHGVSPEKLLYQNLPQILPNTLITAGQFEPRGLAANAADLVAGNTDPTIQFHALPGQSHVSVLFSPGAARMSQAWAARVLNIPNPARLPSLLYLGGSLLGFLGILLLSGPFLRELATLADKEAPADSQAPGTLRFLLEVILVSFAVLFLLRHFIPLRVLGLFEGGYLASFFLLAGAILVLLHPKLALKKFAAKPGAILGAAVGALLLHLLVTGWFDLTASSAWLTLQRWARFPLFFLAAFVFLYALEILFGPVGEPRKRLLIDYLAILLAWLVLVFGTFILHTGQILVVLLLPYFALFFLFSRLGARLVRQRTASATAAAVFGAILLAGFCLVLFPLS
ncbi:MAG TPA: alpha/beta fold hydrolase [Candidatus Acidoferrales bacterium]|jgi:pimeloyl-ACP methyl ester carboxylesterase|nr:alpha/beta fold hydrolase [Candidatus Acidoferrales bacterium]